MQRKKFSWKKGSQQLHATRERRLAIRHLDKVLCFSLFKRNLFKVSFYCTFVTVWRTQDLGQTRAGVSNLNSLEGHFYKKKCSTGRRLRKKCLSGPQLCQKQQKFHDLQSNFDYFLNFDSNAGRVFETPGLGGHSNKT